MIKSLRENVGAIAGIARATILGDGSVALILDVDAMPFPRPRTPGAVAPAPVFEQRETRGMSQALDGTSAVRPAALAGAEDARQFVTFTLGEQQYCVDVMSVREICTSTPITPLPSAPDFLRGVINLRGTIVPIIDLRTLRPGPDGADGEPRRRHRHDRGTAQRPPGRRGLRHPHRAPVRRRRHPRRRRREPQSIFRRPDHMGRHDLIVIALDRLAKPMHGAGERPEARRLTHFIAPISPGCRECQP